MATRAAATPPAENWLVAALEGSWEAWMAEPEALADDGSREPELLGRPEEARLELAALGTADVEADEAADETAVLLTTGEAEDAAEEDKVGRLLLPLAATEDDSLPLVVAEGVAADLVSEALLPADSLTPGQPCTHWA